jgi:hypothetical protein
MQVEMPEFALARPEQTQAEDNAAKNGLAPAEIAQIYACVFRRHKPRTAPPEIRVQYRKYANANAHIKLENSVLDVRLADSLSGAPEDVMEALAEILLAKLFRRPIPRWSNHRYRRYLNSRDVRESLDIIRQTRGRKRIVHPKGDSYDLDAMFDDINVKYFFGLMARPALGWSPNASRTLLGHYDPSHNAIVISRILDRPNIPSVIVEYVLFHEMLHLRYPAEHKGARRRVHTKEFKAAEREFAELEQVKTLLKRLL